MVNPLSAKGIYLYTCDTLYKRGSHIFITSENAKRKLEKKLVANHLTQRSPLNQASRWGVGLRGTPTRSKG